MNNGVENNQVVEPVIISVDPNTVPQTPVEQQYVQTVTTYNNNEPGVVNQNPQPVVYNMPEPTPQSPQPETTPVTTPETTPIEENTEEKPKKRRRRSPFSSFLFILLVGVSAYAYYLKTTTVQEINQQRYQCSPAFESKEEKALDINSTLVKDLYQKVATNVLEDYFQPEWDDTMKVYLAYRQIPDYKKYETNCNLYQEGRMENYVCVENSSHKPKTFKREALELEWKKLFGESTNIPKINVNLKAGCIGGYEYIPEREEYVEGYCKNAPTTTIKVTKKLKEAYTSNHTITLVEEVNYMGKDNTNVPNYLVSGNYYYTFRLDMNYNYILISKQYDQKYE